MYAPLTTFLNRMDHQTFVQTQVIAWSCPVLSFGDPSKCEVATLGINPSNREFVDSAGNELEGTLRRFQTLHSLGLASWAEADSTHLQRILDSCCNYFARNPYDVWFKKLDRILSGLGASYYGSDSRACHLDLIPYATFQKWTDLTTKQRSFLLEIAGDTLAALVAESPIRVLIMNGRSVVNHVESLWGIKFERRSMPEWLLTRRGQKGVEGLAYFGAVSALSGVVLNRKLFLLGYNHNIQSSFGVTTSVIESIRDWVAETAVTQL